MDDIRWFTLKNSGGFVVHMWIKGCYKTIKNNKDIRITESKTIDLAKYVDNVYEGNQVYLQVQVVGKSSGVNASEKFVYKRDSKRHAHYTISGVLGSIKLKLNSIKTEENDINYDEKQVYDCLGVEPKGKATNYSNDVQGICHDDSNWYISHGAGTKKYDRNYGEVFKIPVTQSLSKNVSGDWVRLDDCKVYNHGVLENHRFYKFFNSANEAVGAKIGEIHFGDIDCYRGHVFVPVYQNGEDGSVDAQILVFSTKNFDLEHQEILYKNEASKMTFGRLGWCAVNPNDGCLYASDSHISRNIGDGCSPVMAFKINLDNLGKGKVFTNVTEKGIDLLMPDGSEFEMAACMQGGCFDPYDTLYLVSGFEERKKHDGVFAFKLQRNVTSVLSKYISDRAYYIWVDKGRPLQTKEEAKKDWLEATWQINSAMANGTLMYSKAPESARAYFKKRPDGQLVSAIDFSFDGDALIYPEEPEGITYWDLRRTTCGDAMCGKSTLHVLRLKNNGESLIRVQDSYNLHNYNITSMETTDRYETFSPSTLRSVYNPVSQNWAILDGSGRAILEFSTSSGAEKALTVLRQFRALVEIAAVPGPGCGDKHDLGRVVLLNPVGTVNASSDVSFGFDFDIGDSCVQGLDLGSSVCKNPATERVDANQGYLFFWAAMMENPKESSFYPMNAYNERDVWRLFEMAKGYSRICFTRPNTASGRAICWFE